jgi:hypothetical protein
VVRIDLCCGVLIRRTSAAFFAGHSLLAFPPFFLYLLAVRLASTLSLVLALGACNTPSAPTPLTPDQIRATESSVRAFTADVARNITAQGPLGWHQYFSDSPNFFMAVDGHLVFPDAQSASKGIDSLPSMIAKITLQWGDDLRVDVLSPDLALVASSFTEVQTDPKGHQRTETGFFTGLAENRNGRWQFRDAHWSDPVPTP